MVKFFVLCVALFGVTTAMEFTCDNVPVGKEYSDGHVLHLKLGNEFFEPGKTFTVTVESVNTRFDIRHFAIQARDPAQEMWGTWHTSSLTALQGCTSTGSMLVSVHPINAVSFNLVWNVPDVTYPSAVEFHLTAMFNNDTYHTHITPIVREKSQYNPHESPSELDEETGNPALDEEEAVVVPGESEATTSSTDAEDPNGGETLYADMADRAEELDRGAPSTEAPSVNNDLHDPAPEIAQSRDAAERRAEMIATEDANNEGDWSVAEAEAERRREEEYDWELKEQERVKYEEDKKRQEIILWEIRDKEEHDEVIARQTTTLPAPEESEEIDLLAGDSTGGASGSSVLVASLATIIGAILLNLF